MMTVRRASATLLLIVGLIVGSSAGWLVSARAQAPLQLSPPAVAAPGKPALKPAPKPVPHKPVAPPAASVEPTVSTPETPERDADLAYGAFQRGFYMTAFSIATRRVEEKNDIKAMTLLGELYANGFGIERNDKKAAEWYQLAADRGDRGAMFAFGMFH